MAWLARLRSIMMEPQMRTLENTLRIKVIWPDFASIRDHLQWVSRKRKIGIWLTTDFGEKTQYLDKGVKNIVIGFWSSKEVKEKDHEGKARRVIWWRRSEKPRYVQLTKKSRPKSGDYHE